MDNFDFEKVNKVMKVLNWTWHGKGVPTLKRLKEEAVKYLNEALRHRGERDSRFSTGGYEVEYILHSEYQDSLSLKFVLEDWESY